MMSCDVARSSSVLRCRGGATLLALALVAKMSSGVAADATPFALTGARIHPISDPVIEDGVLVVEDGIIVSVGPADGTAIPSGHAVIDAGGLELWPGLIDARTVLGLYEVGSVRGTLDYSESGVMNPSARSLVAINPSSELIPVARADGILLTVVAPKGGLVSGLASVIALDGWTWEEMVRADPIALIVNWPGMAAKRPDPDAKAKASDWNDAVADLSAALEEARTYAAARAAGGEHPRDVDVQWEALARVTTGELPVWVTATTEAQIRAALDWTARENLRMVLVDGGDAWRCAEALAERGIPVITRSITMPRRRSEPYDTPFAGPARLHAAGVRIGFRTDSASNVRRLAFEAARAAAYGLPRDVAERAITLTAAEILGIADRYGSLEPGKSATFILTDGDVLETRTHVRRAWIDGSEIDLSSRHTELYETYRNRPRPGN